METVIKVTPDSERYPNNLELYINNEWGNESRITIPKWKVDEVVEKLKKFISVSNCVSRQLSLSDTDIDHEADVTTKEYLLQKGFTINEMPSDLRAMFKLGVKFAEKKSRK